jgi:sigma54-dependent transcription regulator
VKGKNMQVVRQVTGIQGSLHRHHSATNIHPHCRRNDCTLRRNHASNSRAAIWIGNFRDLNAAIARMATLAPVAGSQLISWTKKQIDYLQLGTPL